MLLQEKVQVRESVQQKQHTVEGFERFLRLPENRDRLFELVNGEIVEKMPTQQHGIITVNVSIALGSFVKQHKLGRVGAEVRYLKPKDKLNSRMPDISFTRGRQPLITEGGVPQMPDLAIEIKSPDDTHKEMREKADYYLANGVREVWLIFPHKRYIEIHRPEGEEDILFGSDVLDGGDLLPGFTMPVVEVFADHVTE